MLERIKCPICGLSFNDLMGHIKVHKEEKIFSRDDLIKKFPEYENKKLHIDKREEKECKCIFCDNVIYKYNNALSLHYKKCHPEYFNEIHVDKRKLANLICPICNKNFGDMKQHVNITHRLEWEEFCNNYNWDIKKTKCITNEYRNNLSKNKIKFYNETERGLELRKEQSEKWSGDGNISKNRETISKSIESRARNENMPIISHRGIKVLYKNHCFRSFTEFTLYIICIDKNIKIEYEPKNFHIKWYNSEKKFLSTYIPDFYIENIGLIELKESNWTVNIKKKEEKYIKTKSIYDSKKIEFDMYSIGNLLKKLNINLKEFEKRILLKKYINDALDKDEIKILCQKNSSTVKYYFGENIEENKNITIIK